MSEKKNNYKDLNSEIKESDKINQIISDQTTKMEKIHEILSDFVEIYVSYIKLSKEYSNKIENLAMKLKPDDKTFEGQIIQVFQNILLFNSNSLNKMIKDMNNFYQQESKNKDYVHNSNTFSSFKELYAKQYTKTMDSYKTYKKGLENLEDYLVQKELGNNKEENNIDEKINNVYSDQEKFSGDIKDCNNLLKNLFNYFSMQKNAMRTQLFNYCNKFNSNVVNYINKQNETCLNQKLILDDLTKSFNLKEIEEKEFIGEYLTANPYPLKSLKLAEEKEEIFNIEEKTQLNFGQALNILQVFENNGLILNNGKKVINKEELDKKKMSNYLSNIFDSNNLLYNDIDNQEIILLLREKSNQEYILKLLNNYRMKGKYQLSKGALSNLGFVFQYLNELVTKNLDAKLFTQLFIMAFTFYYQEKEKVNDGYIYNYLFEYIWNCEIFKDRKFWENYLEGLIIQDIKDTPPDELNLNFTQFVQTMTVIKSMTDLNLASDFVSEFMEYIFDKYKLKDDQKVQVNDLFYYSIRVGSFSRIKRSTISSDTNGQSFHNSLDNKRFLLSENRSSNVSNIIIAKGNESEDDKYESDGSGESIELEDMTKKQK